MIKVTLIYEFLIFSNNQIKILQFFKKHSKIKMKIYKILFDMVVLDNLNLLKTIANKHKIKIKFLLIKMHKKKIES